MHGPQIPDSELFRVLRFIRDFREKMMNSPTTRDIVNALGYSSTSVAHYRLDALLDRGWLTMEAGKSRTVRPTEAGLTAAGLEDRCPSCGRPLQDEPTVRVHESCVRQ